MNATRAPGNRGPAGVRAAAVGGALGGAVALLVLLLARVGGGSPGILEVVADAVVRAIPPPLFDWGLATFGTAAKGLLFAGVCAGVVVAGAGLAAFLRWARLVGPGRALRSSLVASLAALLLGELLVLPLAGAGLLGSALLSDPRAVHGPLLVAAAAYGLTVGAWLGVGRGGSLGAWRAGMGGPTSEAGAPPSSGADRTDPAPGSPVTRRSLLAGLVALVGLGSLAASGLVVATRVAGPRRQPLPGPPDEPGVEGFGFTRAVTPIAEFYMVSKDWVALEVDPAAWRLRVAGLVEEAREWTLDELRALPAQEGYRTLQCISAESITRTELIGNQRWKGFRVAELLCHARPTTEAAYVIWRCADGYHESLDLDTALLDDTWLVYEMGPPGTPLPAEHGRPLRLLVAGRYGMAQPKYITDLIVSDVDDPGWWVVGGWQTDAPVRTYCRIDLPAADGVSDSVVAGHTFTALGVASSGDRGISAVQVSLDGGSSWQDAELEPIGGPIGRLTWVRWRARVRLDEPGTLLFMARAADGTGTWQDEAIEEPFPRGASGYPRVPMRVYARAELG